MGQRVAYEDNPYNLQRPVIGTISFSDSINQFLLLFIFTVLKVNTVKKALISVSR